MRPYFLPVKPLSKNIAKIYRTFDLFQHLMRIFPNRANCDRAHEMNTI